ncbi:hypothetical protein J6590_025679 [Homalodisca vitripennis]|nr:hypothetical protein J6590_025679 [Homalodisca vitripennis]
MQDAQIHPVKSWTLKSRSIPIKSCLISSKTGSPTLTQYAPKTPLPGLGEPAGEGVGSYLLAVVNVPYRTDATAVLWHGRRLTSCTPTPIPRLTGETHAVYVTSQSIAHAPPRRTATSLDG